MDMFNCMVQGFPRATSQLVDYKRWGFNYMWGDFARVAPEEPSPAAITVL